MNESPKESIISVKPTNFFAKNVKSLKKNYPQIGADIKSLVSQLKQGETPGDQITGVGYTVYKVRLKNSDLKKGKSAGYRIIYYIEGGNTRILLIIYCKKQKSDISKEEVVDVIKRYFKTQN